VRKFEGAWAALAAFAGAKLVFVVALAAMVGGFPLAQLTAFDAEWYRSIVVDGYVYTTETHSNLAFFPLYPGVAWLVHALGVNPEWSLLLVAWAGSALAVLGIHRVGRVVGSDRTGWWLALLWAVAPRSHVQAMGYSEGPFTAFVAWALWAALAGRPLLAGALTMGAGLTRPAAVPLMAALWLWWLVGVVAASRAGRRGDRWQWRRLVGAVLGSSGFAAYWLAVAVQTGSPLGYLRVQEAWNSTMGSPLGPLGDVWDRLSGQVDGATWIVDGIVSATILAAIALLVVMLATREHWLLSTVVALGLLLVLTQQLYFNAKARMLLPWFPMWLPVARWLAGRDPWLAAAVGVTAVAGSAWWGVEASLLTGSP